MFLLKKLYFWNVRYIYNKRKIKHLKRKEKIMGYKRKMSEETKKKIGDGNRGKKVTEETRKKISEAIKKLWAQAE